MTASLSSVLRDRFAPSTNGNNGKKEETSTNGTIGKIQQKNEKSTANCSPAKAENQRVSMVAEELVAEFGSPGSRRFFCKVAYAVPYQRVRELSAIARADGTRNPGGLFNVLARRELGEI